MSSDTEIDLEYLEELHELTGVSDEFTCTGKLNLDEMDVKFLYLERCGF